MTAKSDNKPFSTRLPPEWRTALQEIARSKGMTEGELARMFLVEKICEAKSGFAAISAEQRSLAAIIIAALSDSIELDEARELVEKHRVPEYPLVTP